MFAYGPCPHRVFQRTTPVVVIVACECGWSARLPRRQNALARGAKLRAAVRAHLVEVGIETK